jgi:hypothetical protein
MKSVRKSRITLSEAERKFLIDALAFCVENAMYPHNRDASIQFLKRLKK